MKKITIVLILILTMTAVESALPESYTADFLTYPTGARPLGMGNAYTAIANDATAPFYNPAGLTQSRTREVNLMHATLADLAAYNIACYSHPITSKTTMGISWLRVGIDDIPITRLPVANKPVGPTNRPRVTDTFSNTNNAFLLSGARHLITLPRNISVHIGATLKLLYITAYSNTNAIGGGSDIGLIATTPQDKSTAITLGIVATDFFTTKLYWNVPPVTENETPHTETIPPRLKIGLAAYQKLHIFNSRLTLTADVDTRNAYELHTGAEWTLFDLLSLRCGLEGRNGALNRTHHFTAGAGLQLRFITGTAFHVDYAYQQHPDLGTANRISARMQF